MVFSRIINGYAPKRQGELLEALAMMLADGRMRSIMTTRLGGSRPDIWSTPIA
jgi:hypothetical protein